MIGINWQFNQIKKEDEYLSLRAYASNGGG